MLHFATKFKENSRLEINYFRLTPYVQVELFVFRIIQEIILALKHKFQSLSGFEVLARIIKKTVLHK